MHAGVEHIRVAQSHRLYVCVFGAGAHGQTKVSGCDSVELEGSVLFGWRIETGSGRRQTRQVEIANKPLDAKIRDSTLSAGTRAPLNREPSTDTECAGGDDRDVLHVGIDDIDGNH